jgi:hypothetical protein
MNISNNDLFEANKLYYDLKKKYYYSGTDERLDENLNAMNGAGRILSLLGINIEGLFMNGHCPICGRYLGKRDPDDCSDPECANCEWQGKI